MLFAQLILTITKIKKPVLVKADTNSSMEFARPNVPEIRFILLVLMFVNVPQDWEESMGSAKFVPSGKNLILVLETAPNVQVINSL